MIEAEAELVEQLGSDAFVHFSLPVKPVVTPDIRELLEDQGADESTLGEVTKVVARVDPYQAPRNGEKVRLAVNTDMVHFFDAQSGDVIT